MSFGTLRAPNDWIQFSSSRASVMPRRLRRSVWGGWSVRLAALDSEWSVAIARLLQWRPKGAAMSETRRTKEQLRDELAVARQRIAELETALARQDCPGVDPPTPPSLTLPAAFQAAFANSLPGILFLFDAEAHLLWWNQEFERATGYSATELARAAVARFVSAESLPLILQWFQAALDAGSAELEGILIRKDGRQVPYYCTAHRLEFDGAPCVIGMGIDISERLRTERRRYVRLAVPQLLAQATSLANAASGVLQVIAEGLGWDLGILWVADAPAQLLYCLDVWQAPSAQAAEFIETSRKQGFGPGVGF